MAKIKQTVVYRKSPLDFARATAIYMEEVKTIFQMVARGHIWQSRDFTALTSDDLFVFKADA